MLNDQMNKKSPPLSMLLSASDNRLKKYENLRESVNETFIEGRKLAQEAVEYEKAKTYWTVGALIEKHVLLNEKRGDYGKKIVTLLAKDLGTNQTLLYYALQFARSYKDFPQNKKLSWSHYRALLPVKSEKERDELAIKVEEWGWSSRQLETAVSKVQTKKAFENKNSLPIEKVAFLSQDVYELAENKTSDSKKLMLKLGFDVFYQPSKLPGHFYRGDYVKVLSSESSGFKFVKFSKPKGNVRKYLHAWITLDKKSEVCFLVELGLGMTVQKNIFLHELRFSQEARIKQENLLTQIKSNKNLNKPLKVLISCDFSHSLEDPQADVIYFHDFL